MLSPGFKYEVQAIFHKSSTASTTNYEAQQIIKRLEASVQ